VQFKTISSSTLTPKLRGPLRTPLDIRLTDRRSGPLDGFHEIFQRERGFQELVGIDVRPGHFCGAVVAWGAGGYFFFAVYRYLDQDISIDIEDVMWGRDTFL